MVSVLPPSSPKPSGRSSAEENSKLAQAEAKRKEARMASATGIAQSLVSLGTLALERGDDAAARAAAAGSSSSSSDGGGGGGSSGSGSGDGSGGSSGGGSGGGSGGKAAADYWAEARQHYGDAVEWYSRTFHGMHPKLWWVHQGLGNVHEREGNAEAAKASYALAAKILSVLEEQDGAAGAKARQQAGAVSQVLGSAPDVALTALAEQSSAQRSSTRTPG